jgi:hypothetical protein
VKDLIPHGLSVLAGASKTGKSWLVLWLAMRVSQGLPVWERATRQCEVLYLCLEDTFPRIQRRMYRLNEEPVPELRLAVMCDKLHGGLEEQIAEQLRSYPNTGFIIIDTLQKVRDPRDTDSGNMYACDYDAMASLKRIADEHDIGILLVHHIRKTKDSEDPFNEILGSNGVMGGLDTVLLLKRKYRGAESGTLRVTGRDVEDRTIPLAFHDCIWELAEPENGAEEAPPPDLYPPFLYALADFMQSRKRWEGTATELVEAVAETEIKPKGVVRCLSRFYCEFLESRGIRFHAHRTGQSRLICLARDDANDVNDDNDEKSP